MIKHFQAIIVILLLSLLAGVSTVKMQNQKTIVLTNPKQGFINDFDDSDTSNFGEKGTKLNMNDRDLSKFLIPERDDDFSVIIDYPGLGGQPSPDAFLVPMEPFIPTEAFYLVNKLIDEHYPTGSRKKLKDDAPGSSPYKKYTDKRAVGQNGSGESATQSGTGVQDGTVTSSTSSTTNDSSGSAATSSAHSASGNSISGSSQSSSTQIVFENGVVTENTSKDTTTTMNNSSSTVSLTPSGQQTSSSSITTSPDVVDSVLASIHSAQSGSTTSGEAGTTNGSDPNQTSTNSPAFGNIAGGSQRSGSSETSETSTPSNSSHNSQIGDGSQNASSTATQLSQTNQINNLISANGSTNVQGSGSNTGSSTSSTSSTNSDTTLTPAQVLGITQSHDNNGSNNQDSIISQVLGTQQPVANSLSGRDSDELSLFKPFTSNSNSETSQLIVGAPQATAATTGSSTTLHPGTAEPSSVINSVVVPLLHGSSNQGTEQISSVSGGSTPSLSGENFIGFPKRATPDDGSFTNITMPSTNSTLSTKPTKTSSGSYFKLSAYTMAVVLLSLLV